MRIVANFDGVPADHMNFRNATHYRVGNFKARVSFSHDNDFVIGLLGPDLFPLSAVVQEMRKTEQTSQFLDSLGPFFIGKVAWQSPKTL